MAETKSQAKMANRIAKKFPVRTKVHIIDDETKLVKALKWLDVEDTGGLGGSMRQDLRRMGVHKAFDFTQLPEQG